MSDTPPVLRRLVHSCQLPPERRDEPAPRERLVGLLTASLQLLREDTNRREGAALRTEVMRQLVDVLKREKP